jgi:adenylate cyclase
MQRRLTAILYADVVGYSGLMEADEFGTLQRLKHNRLTVFEPQVAAHGGRVVKLIGDGALVEFPSIVSAVNCAVGIQAAMARCDQEEERPIQYRIGVNLGDVLVEGDDIYGDGVNIAARLQALAPVGGVALSATARDHARGKVLCEFDDLGEHVVKNIETPVHVFLVRPLQDGASSVARTSATQKPSICILPFANMSDDPQQEYFSDGITEDIITDLSKISALSVIARNSAFAFKGKNVDIPQIARQLNVTHVLEGSVRKVGDRVRITAQLIEGALNVHVWAERFDRDQRDIFALQDEISHAIVNALALKLLPQEGRAIGQRGTKSHEAYDLYLMARRLYLGDRFTTFFDLNTLINLCKSAIAIDQDYALAWAHLGLAEAVQFTTGRVSCDDGRDAAERALVLDSALAESHMAMARVLLNEEKTAEALGEIEIALRLDPESTDAKWIGALILRAEGRYQDAIGYLEAVVVQYPEGLVPAGMLMITCVDEGDIDRARDVARQVAPIAQRTLDQNPAYGTAMGYLALAKALLGEEQSARALIERGLRIDPANSTMKIFMVCAYAELNDLHAALLLFDELVLAANTAQLRYFRRVAQHVIRADARFEAALAQAGQRLLLSS